MQTVTFKPAVEAVSAVEAVEAAPATVTLVLTPKEAAYIRGLVGKTTGLGLKDVYMYLSQLAVSGDIPDWHPEADGCGIYYKSPRLDA